MTGFLTEVGKKLADRWIDQLVLPGLLWVAVLVAGLSLGQQDPFDLTAVRDSLDRTASHPASHSLGTVLLVCGAVFAAAAGAGLAASALGALVQRLWVLESHHPLLAWLVRARQRRWTRVTEAARTAIAHAAHATAHHEDPVAATARARRAERRRRRLPTAVPQRPSRVGDRLHATATRIAAAYGFDVGVVWPRLWAVLPDPLRADIGAAQNTYVAAARLTAWGGLYLILGAVWWPAAVVGLAVLAAGRQRATTAADVLTDLVETATDLHTADLAAKLGIPADPPITAETGQAITRFLRKTPSTPPPDDPRASR
jgi:hypothetical protein